MQKNDLKCNISNALCHAISKLEPIYYGHCKLLLSVSIEYITNIRMEKVLPIFILMVTVSSLRRRFNGKHADLFEDL